MIRFKRSVFVFIMVLFNWHLLAQPIDSIRFNEIKEQISLITDRDIYFVNEDVLFAAQTFTNVADEQAFSQIIYVEIIDYRGRSFNQGKYLLKEGFCSAKIKVPQSLVTGTYYLKAYTKWMRNFSNQEYFYYPVTIINPQTNEVLNKASNYHPDFTIDTISNQVLAVNIEKQNSNNGHTFRVQPVIENKGNYILSASNAIATSDVQIKLQPLKNKQAPQNINYLPETRGMSITGQVILPDSSSMPAKYVTVYLTLLNENNTILNIITDEKGRFQFVLPDVYGTNEILLSVKNDNNLKLQINVDYDYCERPVQLPFISTEFINSTKELLNPLSLTSQINHYFESDNRQNKPEKFKYQSTIDDESKVVYIEDYISMPNLRDYFDELYPQVHIYKADNNKIMLDNSAAFSEMYIYQPLIKIDNVVVTDNSKFLKVNTSELDRIEIFNKPYIIGNEVYGGVINVYSKDGNWADMKLPEGAVIFDYEMLSPDMNEKQRLQSSSGLANTIYWEVQSVSSTDKLEIKLENENNFGTYNFRVRSINQRGEIAQKDILFQIK